MSAADATDRVFVYGTLRPGQANHGRVAGFVRQVEPARLSGHSLWTCGAFPGARPAAEGVVEGVVFTLERPAEALAALDVFEEVPTLYERVRVVVCTRSDSLIDAWTYLLALRDLRGWAFLGSTWPGKGA